MKYVALILGIFFCISCTNQYYYSKEGIKVLDKQQEFVGSWTGTGKMYAAPNEEGTFWTATVNYKRAYDDILVQKKEIIEMEGSQPLASLSFLGWDLEAGNPVLLSVGNDGKGARKHSMTIIGDNKYQVTRTTMNDLGQTVFDQMTTNLIGDTYTVITNRSIDGGTPFINFEGTYTRNAEAGDVHLDTVSALVPLSDATKRIACMAGTYKQKGHFQGHPIDGDESIELILGGHAMFINFKFKEEAGDGYFGSSLTSWNSDKNRFTGFMVSNDGMTAAFEAWLSEDNSQLIYEPLNHEGEGLKDERWHADLNLDEDHCLLQVLVGKNKESSKGLYIKFTKVETFNPPNNLQVKRTYAMKSSGYKTGEMESIRKVDNTQSTLLVKDDVQSYVGITEDTYVTTKESFWLGAGGVGKYQGEFTDSETKEVTNINFKLQGNTVHFESKTHKDSKPYKQKFVKGKDFHWSTIYIDPTNRELEKGKEYARKILDVSFARTMNLKEKFLGMKEFKLGEHVFNCYVLWMDYGHVEGEIWVAKDELGWFLVYEDAVATEGPFELVLESYTRTNKKL
jgi:hypothetical protein